MCRWVAYCGEAAFLESLISTPHHSLIEQSRCAEEAKADTNADGFGVGWYDDRPIPGLFRDVLPAWSDENLRNLAHQVRARLFFAHVRASTGEATSRVNCHPFAHGRWLFMHNGQIGPYARLRRPLEQRLPDALYNARKGTTDSELIFLNMLAEGLEEEPLGAARRVCGEVLSLAGSGSRRALLRLTAAFTDGQTLYALRYVSDDLPPSLYWRRQEDADGICIVSEPLDRASDAWHAVPKNSALIVDADGVRSEAFEPEAKALGTPKLEAVKAATA